MPATNVVAPSIGSASIRILPDITGFGPNLSRELGQRAPLIAGAFGAALALPLAASVGAAIEFEDSFAAVRKTVEATSEELDTLALGIREMATEIPVATSQLNEIAAVAGQLGVEVGSLENFTEVIAKLGVAAESIDPSTAATEMARFINITNGSLDDVDKLGAAIVDLGNKFPSTEAEILRFSQLIAGAGTVLGLTQADILGISNAVASAGIRAERGGSSISRLIMEIQQAALTGGPKLQTFADVLGITTSAFQNMVANDPKEAIVQFIEAFGRLSETAPEETIQVLEDLDLNTIRVRDSMLRLGIAADVVRDSVTTANTAFAEGTALDIEAEKRFDTLASAIKVLGNTLHELFITVGDEVAPAIGFLVEGLQFFLEMIRLIPGPVLAGITVITGLAGSAIAVGAAFAYSLQFIARLIQFLGPLRRDAGGIIGLFKQMAFTVGETGTKAAAAAGSLDAVRASATLTTRSMAANIALFGAWAIAIGAVVGAYLILKNTQDEFAASTIDVKSAVDILKTSLGESQELVENYAGTIDSIPDEKIAKVSFQIENSEAILLLQSMSSEGRTAFGAQLLLELLVDGRTPKDATTAVQALFSAAGFTLPTELVITNIDEIPSLIQSQGGALADTIIDLADPIGEAIGKINSTGGLDFLPKLFTPQLLAVEDAAASAAQTIFELGVTAESPFAAVQLWEDYEKRVRDSNLTLQAQDAILKNVAREVGEISGLAGFDPSNVTDMLSAIEEFERLGVDAFVFGPQTDIGFSAWRGAANDVVVVNEDLQESLIDQRTAWLETDGIVTDSSDRMALAVSNYNVAVAQDMAEVTASFQAGIPILSEYSNEVDLNLQEATNAIVLYAQDEAKWQALREALAGRISTETQAALDGLSLPQQAALSDAILGDDESARTAALNWLSTVEATMTDPAALADLDLSDFTISGDKAFRVLPEIDIDSPIRVPPSVREQVGDDIFETVEAAFSEAGEQGVFSSAEELYRVAASLAIDAFVDEEPGSRAIVESFTGIELPTDVVSEFEDIGYDLAEGTWTGWENFGLAGRIAGSLSGEAGSVVSEVRKRVGISSPSTLFAEKVGLPIAQGIAMGIDKGASEVLRSSDAIFDAISPPAGAGTNTPSLGTSIAQGPVTNNFNIAFNNPAIRHDTIEDSRRVMGVLRTATFATPNGRIT